MAKTTSEVVSEAPQPSAPPKGGKERSPSYPFISLKEAVTRLEAFEKYFGRHPGPAAKAGLAWDMKEKSSQAYQTLAALKAFGLVEYKGSSQDWTATLTEDARTYLRAQQPEIKKEVLKRCALKPKAIHTFWQLWGADRPPDPVCQDELVLKRGFTESAAKVFLRVYDATIDYSGLGGDDKAELKTPKSDLNPIEAGDLVQWESTGVLQFPQPRRVRSVTDDGYAFVEGSDAGIPIGELIVVDAQELGTPAPAKVISAIGRAEGKAEATARASLTPFKQDVYTLGDEGQVILQWPEKMTQESYDELVEWIDLQLRKIARISGVKAKERGKG